MSTPNQTNILAPYLTPSLWSVGMSLSATDAQNLRRCELPASLLLLLLLLLCSPWLLAYTCTYIQVIRRCRMALTAINEAGIPPLLDSESLPQILLYIYVYLATFSSYDFLVVSHHYLAIVRPSRPNLSKGRKVTDSHTLRIVLLPLASQDPSVLHGLLAISTRASDRSSQDLQHHQVALSQL